MSDIKQSVLDLAAALKADLSLGENGHIGVAEGAGERTLPSTLSAETVKHFQDHVNDLVAATYLAAGEIGVDAFKADENLDRVSLTIPFFADSVSVEINRSKEYPAGGVPKEGEHRSTETVTKYGVGYSKYNVNANGNKGALKKVRDRISAMAAEALSK